MPTGSVGLLYEVGSSNIPADVDWPVGKGFSIDVETVIPGPAGRVRLVLQLSNDQYRDVFSALCGDVAGIVAGEQGERQGVKAFVRRLHAWQKFMQLHSPTGLSLEQVRGLYAELCVLEHLLIQNAGSASAVEMWRGRQGLHDFANGGRSLEVKSSTVRSDPLVSISRLDQLDETQVEVLYLCFVPLDEGEDDGENLPDTISRLRNILRPNSTAAQRFDDLLVAYGYHDTQAGLYSDIFLRSGQRQLYRVSEGFPRIRIDELSEGIVSGKYSIRLSYCYEHLVDEVEFLKAFLGADYDSK